MPVKYRRILLMIRGEALAGQQSSGLDFVTVLHICESV